MQGLSVGGQPVGPALRVGHCRRGSGDPEGSGAPAV